MVPDQLLSVDCVNAADVTRSIKREYVFIILSFF